MRIKLAGAAMALAAALTAHGGALAQEGKTREQVKAELAEAIRTGDIILGDSSLKEKDLWPKLYPAPAPAAAAGKTREQVKAELAEAIRNGEITVGDSIYKENELWPGRYPGVADRAAVASRRRPDAPAARDESPC